MIIMMFKIFTKKIKVISVSLHTVTTGFADSAKWMFTVNCEISQSLCFATTVCFLETDPTHF